MSREQRSRLTTNWTRNLGAGTSGYRSYSRYHEIEIPGKIAPLSGSSDPAFRGDPARWNPEELLLASISACHKLWYLGLCARAGISVLSYRDEAEATMLEDAGGAGRAPGGRARSSLCSPRSGARCLKPTRAPSASGNPLGSRPRTPTVWSSNR